MKDDVGKPRPPIGSRGHTSVAVILLTIDQRETTLRCLSSLVAVNDPPLRIVVWDNGSVDGTVEAVADRYPEVIIHRSPRNVGAAGGRNAAAELALARFDPTYMLFLDNDTVVTPDLVRRLVEPILSSKTVGQTAPKIRLLDDPDRIDMAGGCRIRFWRGDTSGIGSGELDRGQYDAPYDCVGGGCSLVTASAFRQIGGFDTKFDPYGYEDMDFSLRLIRAGYRCRYVPEAVLYHAVTQSFEQGRYTARYARFKARNWLLFLWRHASWSQRLGFLLVGAPLRLAHRVGEGQGRASRGLLAGTWDFVRSNLAGRRSP